MQYSTVNSFPLLFDFLNNIFSTLLCYKNAVSNTYIKYMLIVYVIGKAAGQEQAVRDCVLGE